MQVDVAMIFVCQGAEGFDILVEDDFFPNIPMRDCDTGENLANEIGLDYFGADSRWILFRQVGVDGNTGQNGVVTIYYLTILPERVNSRSNLAEWVNINDFPANHPIMERASIALRGVGFGPE